MLVFKGQRWNEQRQQRRIREGGESPGCDSKAADEGRGFRRGKVLPALLAAAERRGGLAGTWCHGTTAGRSCCPLGPVRKGLRQEWAARREGSQARTSEED